MCHSNSVTEKFARERRHAFYNEDKCGLSRLEEVISAGETVYCEAKKFIIFSHSCCQKIGGFFY